MGHFGTTSTTEPEPVHTNSEPTHEPTREPKTREQGRGAAHARAKAAAREPAEPGPVEAYRKEAETADPARIKIAKLTQGERRILYAVTDPANLGKKLDELAELAGMTLRRFRKAMRGAHLQEAINEATMRRVGWALPAILQAAVDSAQIVGKDGFNDRAMILTMMGIYKRGVPTFYDVMGAPPPSRAKAAGSISQELARVGERKRKFIELSRTASVRIIEEAENDPVAGPDLPEADWLELPPDED